MRNLPDKQKSIDDITAADAASDEAEGLKREIEKSIADLSRRISEGVESAGDPAELAKTLAPLHVERTIYETRLPRAEAAAAAANAEYCRVCGGWAGRWLGVARDLLQEELDARGREYTELWKKWGLSEDATRGSRTPLACAGDSLEPLRNIIESLSVETQGFQSGRLAPPRRLLTLIGDVAARIAEPAAV